MHKSSSEILREYANMIAEGDLGNPYNNTAQEPEDFADDFNYGEEGGPMRDAINQNANAEENGIDLPDESMMDGDSSNENPGDPAGELASFLGTDADKINQFLKQHNLELTPVGGLANSKGNI